MEETRWRPKIGTLLLLVGLLTLFLPLMGIGAFRFYENELIRRTEAVLIGQATTVREVFASELRKSLRKPQPTREEEGIDPSLLILPKLDLSKDEVHPALPEALPSWDVPNAAAQKAGAEILQLLERTTKRTLVGFRVVDDSGLVVSSSGSELGLSLANRTEVLDALDGYPQTLLRARDSEESPSLQAASRGKRVRVFVLLPVIIDGDVLGAVIASRTPLDIAKAIYQYRHSALRYILLLLFLLLLITTMATATIVRPIKRLVAQVQRVVQEPGSSSSPIERPRSQEIAALSRSISEMSDTINQRTAYIESFAKNVSHEFKTPLTAMTASLELLDEHFSTMDSTERKRFLTMIKSEVDRLGRLVNRLLLLARADTLQPKREQMFPGPLAVSTLERYSDRLQKLSWEVCEDLDKVSIAMSREVFESILTNLLDNVESHAGADSRINVTVQTKEKMFVLDVADDGPGISDANRSRVFDTFFTTQRELGGTGLGLSIVRSFLESHDATIELLDSAVGCHFRIRIPIFT